MKMKKKLDIAKFLIYYLNEEKKETKMTNEKKNYNQLSPETKKVLDVHIEDVLFKKVAQYVNSGTIESNVVQWIDYVGLSTIIAHIKTQTCASASCMHGIWQLYQDYNLSDDAQLEAAIDDFFFDGSFDRLCDQAWSF